MTFLDRYTEQAYALMRIAVGLMFMAHGVQKLFGFPVPFPMELTSLSIAAAVIELVGGGLILVGLLTRPAAFIASGMCAVGYWMVHGTGALYPIVNGGELIALYCFIFLFIATRGAGIWSVDKAIAKS